MSSLRAQCGSDSTLFVGGQVLPAFISTDVVPAQALYVDFAHPAAAAITAKRVDFAVAGAHPFFAQVVVVRPAGSTYTIAAKSAATAFNPPGSLTTSVLAESVVLDQALTFSRGDLLGVIVNIPLAVTYADRPGGYGVYAMSTFGANVGDTLPAPTATVQHYGVAAAAQGVVACKDVPPAELLIPAIGDVVGQAHFTSRLDVEIHTPPGVVDSPVVNTILLDRFSNPDSAHIIGGSFQFDASGAYHADSFADALGIAPPFFGPLILQFPGTSFAAKGGKTIFASAAATIVADNACNGGETGSVIQAVGCAGIGREVRLHFHVPPDHRANLGIVSARLESCGVPVAATSVTVNGKQVNMPAESTQINDITGVFSPFPELIGATDATIIIRVTDNASRLAAYVSVLDNRSQDSIVYEGVPTN